jgi:hypothetical protein
MIEEVDKVMDSKYHLKSLVPVLKEYETFHQRLLECLAPFHGSDQG